MLSVKVLTVQHPKLIQDVFFPFRFIVFQLLLVLFFCFTLCCNTHIHTQADCALAGGVVFKDGFVVNALHALSVGLCRGNCVLYKGSLYALACASGNAFCADADIPTSEVR